MIRSTNTIKTGSGADIFTLGHDTTNKVTTSGNDNTFNLNDDSHSVIKTTGSGSNTFNITLNGCGYANIKSGSGIDKLNVINKGVVGYYDKVIADTGAGDDIVNISLDSSVSTISTNIKTGKGEDDVTISAGLVNNIDTGADNDNIEIFGGFNNYISAGAGDDVITVDSTATDNNTTTTIKAGKGNDDITINGGTNIIYGEAGVDTLSISGGINTIYGGNDKIFVYGGGNIINANSDTIKLSAGNNTVNTKSGKSTIDITGGVNNTINLLKGTNTVNVTGGTSEDYIRADVNISAGKNIINIGGYSIVEVNSTTKSAKSVNIKDNAFCGVKFGAGADTITNSATIDEVNSMYSGAGNDKFYISNGKTKRAYGEDGNVYFEIISGTSHYAYGEAGNDTFVVKAGNGHKLYGGEGNDTFNINGGSQHTAYGNEGNDTYNITEGSQITIYGEHGNDTYNIKGGNNLTIGDTQGDDTYNLYKGARANISDTAGKNKINIKKGYSGLAVIMNCSDDNKYTFDKSYKLTNEKNINGDVIVTDNNSLTLYCTYSDLDKSISTFKTLTMNIKEEIKDTDRNFDDSSIFINSNSGTYNVGGKNYTLDLTLLKQNLAGWFTDHSAYAGKTTDDVITNGSEADINSLMAVYTKDTASCFVKA